MFRSGKFHARQLDLPLGFAPLLLEPLLFLEVLLEVDTVLRAHHLLYLLLLATEVQHIQ